MNNRIISLLVGCCCSLFAAAQDGLSVPEFDGRLNSQGIQLLDVRSAAEYRSGHLKTALQADWLNKEQFSDRISYLDKTKPVLVYCASGMRSGQAAKWMFENGFTDVQNLKGGITAWKMANKPVEGGAPVTQLSIPQYLQSVNSGTVLVDVGAEWCPPCRKMEPVLSQLQAELKNSFKLVKVDGGNDLDVMKSLNVETLPVFIIYKAGKETWRKQGVIELSELRSHLK